MLILGFMTGGFSSPACGGSGSPDGAWGALLTRVLTLIPACGAMHLVALTMPDSNPNP